MVRQREMLSEAMFNHSTITGYGVERLVIDATDETANNSAEFRFDKYFQGSLGIIGIDVELDGNASDTMTVTAQFKYGPRTTWGVQSQTVLNAVACNTNNFKRIDIQSGWRDHLPFDKVRFQFQKSGTNGACTVIARLVRL